MDYKDTVLLPQTGFAMRANLPAREPELLRRWQDLGLYDRLRQQSPGRPRFILHDGPPYANGHLHIGHAINKVLKDIIVKSRQMMGFDADYVPGWDCHGLPIETKVEQELKKEGKTRESIDTVTFRRRCRDYAGHWVEIQKGEFIRLGVIGNWDHPYRTMDYPFEADIVRELGRFLANGGLYKGSKPVYWCVHDVTALAEAEVEYQDHTSQSIYVKFPLAADQTLTDIDPSLTAIRPVSVVIWTTTAWTIPANLAVALHPQLTYIALEILDPAGHANLVAGELLIVAEGLWESVVDALGIARDTVAIRCRFSGKDLEGRRFRHPYLDQDAPIVLGRHVTLEAGTGCVHIAPGHGHEDYEVGLNYHLPPFNPVDDRGRFTSETREFGGRFIFTANGEIIEHLHRIGRLLGTAPLQHSYPHCWRCHQPVIIRATPQWFISMEHNDLRQKGLAAIRATRWIPSWGAERIFNMVQGRPDWCVSRQRAWGVPITVISCSACGAHCTGPEVIESVARAVERESADVWFQKQPHEFLPQGFVCPQCGGGEFHKESDILDVWFDSGVTHAAVLENNRADGWGLSWPADLYLEGSDQHRGWFHSSLLAAVGTRGTAPYRAVLTHGFVVDGRGRKMSKSLGNVIAPEKVIKQYGADILRMWVSAEDYTGDIRISDEILKGLADSYRRIRNTMRYLLGNLHGFDPARHEVVVQEMPALDRWALDRLAHLIDQVTSAYEEFAFHRVYQDLHYFCAVDMGAFYLDIIKDRLYCDAADSLSRRSAQTVLAAILDALVRLMAPILSFTAEEIWLQMTHRAEDSVHLAPFPQNRPEWRDDEQAAVWKRFREVRSEVYRILETLRNDKVIGSFMEARVRIVATREWCDFLGSFDQLARLLLVASVSVVCQEEVVSDETAVDSSLAGLRVEALRSGGAKCQRCWNWGEDVTGVAGLELCPRCVGVVAGLRR
ncbi:MAG: isoleucine--tRNA ligase [Magnetococcales bacterium]|nr:isoleucine--tRNA ligase [Magnetococcales bacterium]